MHNNILEGKCTLKRIKILFKYMSHENIKGNVDMKYRFFVSTHVTARFN